MRFRGFEAAKNKLILSMDIEQLISSAVQQSASDIHLASGLVPHFRVGGKMAPQGETVASKEFVGGVLEMVLDDEQKKKLHERRQLDFVLHGQSGIRMRGNAFHTRDGVSIALRLISDKIRPLNTLGFPDSVIKQIRSLKNGLVLVVGPTGQGKSTTLAAILQELATSRPQHLITIEDPIEYVIPSGKTVVQQREVGRDVLDFKSGIRAALREDPDTMMVGEMRDHETISSVLTMAETGHVIFSTLHTSDGPQTISRIIDVFPPAQQSQVRSQLAGSLAMIISQRLVPRIDGGVALAYEVLTNTYAVKNYIRQDKVFQIPSALQTDSSGQMVQLEQSLAGLVIHGYVAKEVAMEYAADAEQLKAILKANGVE